MTSRYVTVLDIGSSKLNILTGCKSINNNFNILSSCEIIYSGFINGQFIDTENLKNSIKYSINKAQVNLKNKIDTLYVGVPAEFCFCKEKSVEISFKIKTQIKQKHIDLLFQDTASEEKNKYLINKSALFYKIDNMEKTLYPKGTMVDSIEAQISEVYADTYFINLISEILDKLNINKLEFICVDLAMANYLFTEEQRTKGAVFIDCGSYTTSVSSIIGEALVDLKSFSLGGSHIEMDFQKILKLSINQAEELKSKLILTIQPTPLDVYDLDVLDNLAEISSKTANDIAMSRIEVIVNAIKKCLSSFKYKLKTNEVLYLTGGGLSYIKGIKSYLSELLNRKIIIVSPQPLSLNKPSMSSTVSLLNTAININSTK